jgi:ABC-type proline/glycine betaine transport system permease subunit
MSVGTIGEAKNMSRLAKGRKTPIVDPVMVGVRMERLTRDEAKSLGLNQSEILREALEQAVEVAMRELNYQHPEEIPQAEQSSWLSNLKWW